MNLFKKKNSMYVSFTEADLNDIKRLNEDLYSILPSQEEKEKLSKITIALSQVEELSIQSLYILNQFAKSFNRKKIAIELKSTASLIDKLKFLKLDSLFTQLISDTI